MQHSILLQPSYALAVINLEHGEAISAEAGSLVAMSPTIALNQRPSGKALGSLRGKAHDEPPPRTTFIAKTGPGEVMLAPRAIGDIVAVEMKGESLTVEPTAFLAGSDSLDVSAIGSLRGKFAGEANPLIQIRGTGLVLLSAFGAMHSITLGDREDHIIASDHIVAFDSTVRWNPERATGKPSGLSSFSGSGVSSQGPAAEGLVCRFTGPGRIHFQTRSPQGMAGRLRPHLPVDPF